MTALLLLALAFPGDLPGVDIGVNLPAGFEPSGAVWHDRLERLFVVHDGGTLASMDANGNDVQTWAIGGDFEGVAVADPSTDLIYIGIEQPDTIIEYNFVTSTIKRSFDLTPWMTGPTNSGLESLTYVGGVFLAGLQATGELYRFVLPPSGTTVTFLDAANPAEGRIDLSGSDYHRDTGLLYLVWDSSNVIRAVDPTPPYLSVAEWQLPGNGQEGVAIYGCDLFVSEDPASYSVVMRYGFGEPVPAVEILLDAQNILWQQSSDPRVTYDVDLGPLGGEIDPLYQYIRGSYAPLAGDGGYLVWGVNACGRGD